MSSEAKATTPRKPPGPPGLFGLRNLQRFVLDQLGWLGKMRDVYGDVVHVRMLGGEWFLFNNPEHIEAALVKNARIMGRDVYAEVLERALGEGLLTSDGELWKRQRKLLSNAFTPRRIASYGDTMSRVGARVLEGLPHEQTVNLHQEMSRLTMEVVAEVLFGTGVAREEVESVGHAMEHINNYFANSPEVLLRLPTWVPTPRHRRFHEAVKVIDGVLYRIFAERRAAPPREDLLGTLLAAVDDDGSGMTDQQLRDEAITLFLAGHETTALALAHTLYLLSKHPEVERRLFAEVERALGGRVPTAEDARKLTFTEHVLKESMRLYPPAWATGREAAEDLELGGVRIPKGAQLVFSQWVVHRDPRFFPNPEGFDPDRWEPARAASLPRFAYFPFGGGPRVCIGNHFAMLEATLLLALLVQRFRFELLPGQKLVLAPSVTLRPKGAGLLARVVRRSAVTAHAENPTRSEPARA